MKAMAGSQVVCTITLVSNEGNCTLTARELHGHHTYRIYRRLHGIVDVRDLDVRQSAVSHYRRLTSLAR